MAGEHEDGPQQMEQEEDAQDMPREEVGQGEPQADSLAPMKPPGTFMRDSSMVSRTSSLSSGGQLKDPTMQPFMGMKVRRRASMVQRAFQGDYLHLASNQAILRMLAKQGDEAVLFADAVVKVNRSNEIRRRLLIITDSNLYVLDALTFSCKRHVGLQNIEALCLSELNDNFFAVVVAGDNDCLLASTRKTEIVTVLHQATQALNCELNVVFSNTFTFASEPETTRQVNFEEVEGVLSSLITI